MNRNRVAIPLFLFLAPLLLTLSFQNCKREKGKEGAPPVPEKGDKMQEDKAYTSDLLSVCQNPIERSTAPEERVIAGKRFRVDGYRMELLDIDGDQGAKFGVISDIKNSIEKTQENLRYFIEEFKEEGVEAIIVTGDTGTNYEEIKSNFDILADTGLPVLVIIGNREGVRDFNKAYFEVNGVKGNLINLNFVRFLDWDDADFISVPGYFDRTYIHHPDGCSYNDDDLLKMKPVLSEVDDTPVLISHGPIRTGGVGGIDYAVEAGNIGNPALTSFVKENRIPFGLFGNVIEAGGKAVDLTGAIIVPEEDEAESFFLNPGAANSDPWSMNDRTVSYGMAAIFSLNRGKGSYRIIRVSPPEGK